VTFQGEPVYTLSATDAADWLKLELDGSNSLYRIGFNEPLIAQALETTLADKFNTAPLPEVRLRAADGNQSVGIAGQAGRSPRDASAAAHTIAQSMLAVAHGGGTTVELDWAETPPPVLVADTGPVHANEHWADVNLTTQTLTLFDGATPMETIWISSGRPETPTPQGHHPVAPGQKQLDTALRGSDFYYEHVTWIGWNNMYGVHSAYWHGNFGHPQSHGCVNVSPDQIMDVYNWLDIGDYIEVHE
jgi:hypothetical protein